MADKKMTIKEILKDNIITSNPIFVGFLGMCPSLAVTGRVSDAFAMFLAFTFVTILSNVFISMLRNVIPANVRIPIFITIIAGFVTIVELLMQAYAFEAYNSIALYISLIVVNCIVLGRAEAFASKNKPGASAIDGLGAGLGFGLAIIGIAALREVIGTGAIVFTNPLDGKEVFNVEFAADYSLKLLASPSGGFLMIGLLAGIINAIVLSNKRKAKLAMVAAAPKPAAPAPAPIKKEVAAAKPAAKAPIKKTAAKPAAKKAPAKTAAKKTTGGKK